MKFLTRGYEQDAEAILRVCVQEDYKGDGDRQRY